MNYKKEEFRIIEIAVVVNRCENKEDGTIDHTVTVTFKSPIKIETSEVLDVLSGIAAINKEDGINFSGN